MFDAKKWKCIFDCIICKGMLYKKYEEERGNWNQPVIRCNWKKESSTKKTNFFSPILN